MLTKEGAADLSPSSFSLPDYGRYYGKHNSGAGLTWKVVTASGNQEINQTMDDTVGAAPAGQETTHSTREQEYPRDSQAIHGSGTKELVERTTRRACDWSLLQADFLTRILSALEIPDLISSGPSCTIPKKMKIRRSPAGLRCIGSPPASRTASPSRRRRPAPAGTLLVLLMAGSSPPTSEPISAFSIL